MMMSNQVITSSQSLVREFEVHHLHQQKAVTYTMMLLMGMWMSLTKNPMKPIMAKPIAVAMAIFWNSRDKKNENMSGLKLTSIVMYSVSGEL